MDIRKSLRTSTRAAAQQRVCGVSVSKRKEGPGTVRQPPSKRVRHSQAAKMSLKPKRVEFEKIWPDIFKTIQGVITCGRVERSTWNERFRYSSFFLSGKASALREEDLGSVPTFLVGFFFFWVKSYWWSENWYSSCYRTRHLMLMGQCWDWFSQ